MNSGLGTVKYAIWRFAECEYDEQKNQLWVADQRVDLHPKNLAVLLCLLKAPEGKLTKRELLESVWGSSAAVEQPLLNAISKLRGAISPAERDRVIRTIHGSGFQIVVPVERRELTEDAVEGIRFRPGDFVPGKLEWRLEEALDSSSPHRVWLAKNPTTLHIRLFKFAGDGHELKKLRREIEVFRMFEKARVDLSPFVQFFAWRDTTRPYFIECEHGGQPLSNWAEAQRRTAGLKSETCVQVMLDLAEAVAAAHQCGVLHNSIQPARVLIGPSSTQDASRWTVKLANFSAATFVGPDTRDTQGGAEIQGASSIYQAPEVAAGGEPTRASDVYALGILLFQLLCGDFYRTVTSDWRQSIEDSTLREDIAAATSGDPARRIKSADELAARLRTVEARRTSDRESARELQAEKERAELAEKRLAREKARRPLLFAIFTVLAIGIFTSVWLGIQAAAQRDLAKARNSDLLAMNDFLSKDLLAQSNPFQRPIGSGSVENETLVAAITHASPQIDRRFANAPAISGQLHEVIAGALDARTDFNAAERQFEIAAQCFRKAEGPLSQNALIAEFRRENTLARTTLPDEIQKAAQEYGQQQQIMSRLHTVTPELQGWQALAGTATLMYGPRPGQALVLLHAAIQRAEAASGFSPSLLIGLKLRYFGIYLRLNDPKNAEKAARDAIAMIDKLEGPDTGSSFQAHMALDETLYVQGKFREEMKLVGKDYANFSRVLGPNNQLTLSALLMKALSEGSLEDYDDAIRDALTVYSIGRADPSGQFVREDSLDAVASLECHAGRTDSAIGHARQVIRESSPEATNQPGFVNTATFTIAESLLTEAETPGPHRARLVNRAEELLKTIDVARVSNISGLGDFAGTMEVAQARLALLKGDKQGAKQHAARAEPILEKAGADPYEKRVLARVKQELS